MIIGVFEEISQTIFPKGLNGNELPSRRQGDVWTNEILVNWHTYTSLAFQKLILHELSQARSRYKKVYMDIN